MKLEKYKYIGVSLGTYFLMLIFLGELQYVPISIQ